MAGKSKSAPRTEKVLTVRDLNEEQVKAFKEISKNADLQHILLMESHFKCNHVEYFKAIEEDSIEFSYGSTVKTLSHDKDTGNCFVVFDWAVDAKRQESEEDVRDVVTISSTYMVRYVISGACDPVVVELFLKHVGKVASYPYFRNQVSQKSWEADLELPILPVISA